MPSTSEPDFIKQMTTVQQGLRCLRNAGVDPLAFMQRLNDDPGFRQAVAELFDPSLKKPEPRKATLRGTIGLQTAENVIRHVIGYWSLLDAEEAEMYFRRFDSLEGFKDMISLVDELNFDILADRIGLYLGSRRMTYAELSFKYKLSVTAIKNRETRAYEQMRLRVRLIEREAELEHERARAEERQDIDLLGLTERFRVALRRGEITTIPQLGTKTSDDLLDITNFGEKGLAEVRAKLAERGLYLRGEEPQ